MCIPSSTKCILKTRAVLEDKNISRGPVGKTAVILPFHFGYCFLLMITISRCFSSSTRTSMGIYLVPLQFEKLSALLSRKTLDCNRLKNSKLCLGWAAISTVHLTYTPSPSPVQNQACLNSLKIMGLRIVYSLLDCALIYVSFSYY